MVLKRGKYRHLGLVYGAAIPNFRLVWRPPYLAAIPLPAPLDRGPKAQSEAH